MSDPFQEDITWSFFIHQYYWAFVLILVLLLFIVGLLLWYMRRCRIDFICIGNSSSIMNLYYMHCRKKNPKENDFVSEKPEQYKTPKIKFPTKSCDINRLAMEHAQAYVQKPWDSYLKEESIVKSCMKCVPCASVCDYGTNVKKPNVVNYYTQTPCYPKQLYESNFQMPYAKYDSANTVAATVKSQKIRITQAGISSLPWKNYSRREPRYEYTALGDEPFLHDRLEMDRKLQRDTDRNMSTIRCQYYLRGSARYVFLRHLPDMDSTTKTERLLTMTPMAETCPIKYTSETRQILLDLFLALQHPYIYPVLDIDRKIVMEQEYVIAVLPFNYEGSLKDVIYQSHCQDDWKEKYHFQGYGLSSSQIQRLGCQILEALLFLKDQRFPPFMHLHSGNIIVQNGVARISGLENTLFGYSSRCHLFIPKRLYDNKEAVEVICFGHLLFEMATGYELTSAHPTEKNYSDVEDKPLVIDVLKFIFEQGRYRYPSLRQVASLDFFRHIDLRELRLLMPVPSIKAKLSPAARSILKEVKRHQRSRRQNKRSQSMHAIETESNDGRESRSSGNSSRSYKKKKKRSSLTSTETTPDDVTVGTQMQTMPLASIEGSMMAAPSFPESLDYYTPPTTPYPAPKPVSSEAARARTLLLQEIQSGFKLKSTRHPPNPQV